MRAAPSSDPTGWVGVTYLSLIPIRCVGGAQRNISTGTYYVLLGALGSGTSSCQAYTEATSPTSTPELLASGDLLYLGAHMGLACSLRHHTMYHSAGRSAHQTLRDLVFRDLWEQGYYLTSAQKYGGDFLVYSDLPSRTHSSYIAIVLPWEQPKSSLVSLARVASKVKKSILLCSARGTQASYCIMEWAGIGIT